MNDPALQVLNEILVWTRVGFYGTAKQMLGDVLNSDKKKLAYQLADGTRTGESIRTEVKMSPNDLSDLFKQCTNLGLMKVGEAGKRERLFDLSNFNLMPTVTTPGKEPEGEQAKK